MSSTARAAGVVVLATLGERADGAPSCDIRADYVSRVYGQGGFMFPWNYLAGMLARLILKDADAGRARHLAPINSSEELMSMAFELQPGLAFAWYTIVAYEVVALCAALLLLVLLLRLRVARSEDHPGCCRGGGRVQRVTSSYDADLTSHAFTAGCACLAILFLSVLLVLACSGVGRGLLGISGVAANMQRDLRVYLDNMSCRFATLLDAVVKPPVHSFKRCLAQGATGTFTEELTAALDQLIANRELGTFYRSNFLRELNYNATSYIAKAPAPSVVKELSQLAFDTDLQSKHLWEELVIQFDSLALREREAASFALGGIEEHVAGAEASVAGKTSKVGTIIGSAQNFFPGYTLQERDSFQAAANRQFIMNFMCGAVVLAMDLSLLFILAVAATTHDPHVLPTKRGKASEYAGRALFVSALCTLPVSAFLAAIAAYVMKLSVSSGAFICDPFFQRRPSILDDTFLPHRRSAIDPMVDPILDYITSPSLFQTCSNSFGGFLVGDIDVLANSDVAGIKKLFVKNITNIDFKHSDASLRAYYTKTLNFDRKLSTTQASISVSRIKTIQDMISLGSAHISKQITVQVTKALRLIAEKHSNSVSVAVRGIKDQVVSSVKDCPGLQQIYDAGVSFLCNRVVFSMNGLWVVLMVIASLFNVACYASVRLSKYFLTMDKVEFEDPGPKNAGVNLESEQAGDVERGTGTSDSALAANRPCANAEQEQVAAAEGNEEPSHEAPNCVKEAPEETPGPVGSVTSGQIVEDCFGGGDEERFNKIRRTSPKTRREAVTKAAFEAFRSMSVKLLGSKTEPGPEASQNLESEPQPQPEPSQPEGVVDSADRSSRRLPPCPTGKEAELDAVEAVVVSPKRNTVWFSEEVLEAYS